MVVLLSYDDTSSFGLPRFTKRSIKNMTNAHVNVIPFNLTNHGVAENVYIYTVKKRFPKGANRLCTSLWHTIRRIKFKDPADCSESELQQRQARKVILLADNAADNKNNTLFAWCTELVWRGWYDEVELYYGPVGHTHNGNDAVHFVHNQIAGNFDSVTLAELFRCFYYAWTSPQTRPQPIILDTLYDWVHHYTEHIQEISYYSRSHTNESYVRGFRFKRDTAGHVEMLCKGSPAAKDWCGVDGIKGGPGFHILRSLPQNAPSVLPPEDSQVRAADLAALKGSSVKSYCEAIGRPKSHDWLIEMASTGKIPTNGTSTSTSGTSRTSQGGYTINHKRSRGWGPMENIGAAPLTFDVPFLRPPYASPSGREFWSLSPDVANHETPSLPIQSTIPDVTLPPVAYRKIAAKRRLKEKPDSDSEDQDEKTAPDESSLENKLSAPEVIGEPTEWGANFDLCVVGSFAVIQAAYDNDHIGVSVTRVNNNIMCPFLFM
jgi:hypothetical protein